MVRGPVVERSNRVRREPSVVIARKHTLVEKANDNATSVALRLSLSNSTVVISASFDHHGQRLAGTRYPLSEHAPSQTLRLAHGQRRPAEVASQYPGGSVARKRAAERRLTIESANREVRYGAGRWTAEWDVVAAEEPHRRVR